MMKVYIVEDDPIILESMKQNLMRWGLEVHTVIDFENVKKEFLDIEPHFVILDVTLPKFDGFYWCRQIRDISNVPIIFISSRDSQMDQIMGMNMGADYYIEKPVDMDILMARVNALLRRVYSYKDLEQPTVMEQEGLFLHIDTNVVSYENNKIDLTKNEFLILYTLMQNQTKIVSRDEIMRVLWEDESFVDDNTLTVNIVRLRKKLTEIGIHDRIQTKKGQGYILK
ncbi:response regulator transcription factor [Brochothrix thermosphacta]|uniref:DNA-binding response regulator n=4 Tax=Brochothrix thermosphacta TaxID=2756 RepID=A0A291C1E7_BROTH|nr:DNA-binding response regulator [Brochothrix thermosphacta]ATH86613.1 DNA-binding response regulator [Brochothrix thermosphacta]MPQ29442.1 response regulator transcription factor [Brochothrix thermosphacta]HCZ39327.1 DNA-binding response regulator [Brochothrix thermosphacta]HCZ47123.1 DNA-binding response regulator [Brochothrix thermosphacta]